MSIESLNALAPPTGYTAQGWTWPRVEESMGMKLPNDFKQIVTCYGPGVWLDWIILYVPGAINRHLALESVPWEILDGDRGVLSDLTAEQRAEEFPYLLYPEPGGLFPFAYTSGGDKLYWRTGGHPDDWPIVENDSRDTATTEFPFGIGELLVRYLRDELDEEVFPRPEPRPDKLFVPFPTE